MFAFYQAHFDWRARALFAQRYDDLARHYSLPLPVALGGHRMLVGDASELIVHLHRHREALVARGATALVPHIVAMDLPGCGDRIWLRWREMTAEGLSADWSDVVYQMSGDRSQPLVTAMTYTRLMMPEFGRPSTHRRLVRAAR
ncbi:hypothetical protein [Xinfangfangia pollutisoli]|uniref:hypothetical protein n=1 Tax=Xinfangfangia pollutisoli TaxID=2865960 RepID=UPI001CD72DAE|nr:hypothetical protein [Xinfangfangia pollutisoli]